MSLFCQQLVYVFLWPTNDGPVFWHHYRPLNQYGMVEHGLDPARIGACPPGVIRLVDLFILSDKLLGSDTELADDCLEFRRCERSRQIFDHLRLNAVLPEAERGERDSYLQRIVVDREGTHRSDAVDGPEWCR